MSSFSDITLRSQEQVAQGQQYYAGLAQRSQEGMVAGLRQSAQDITSQRQFQQQMMQRQAEQQTAVQQFEQQFAMQKADADMRLQMHQQEMALNAVKLQHMQAIDATDLSRINVQTAQANLDMRQLDVKKAKKQDEFLGEWGMNPQDLGKLDEDWMYTYGYKIEKGKGLVQVPPKELEAFRADIMKSKARTQSDQRVRDLNTTIKNANDAGDDETALAALKQLRSLQGLTITEIPKAAKPSAQEQANISERLKLVAPQVKIGTLPDRDQSAIAEAIANNRDDILGRARKAFGTPEMKDGDIIAEITRILRDPSSPRYQSLRAYFQAIGAISTSPLPGLPPSGIYHDLRPR